MVFESWLFITVFRWYYCKTLYQKSFTCELTGVRKHNFLEKIFLLFKGLFCLWNKTAEQFLKFVLSDWASILSDFSPGCLGAWFWGLGNSGITGRVTGSLKPVYFSSLFSWKITFLVRGVSTGEGRAGGVRL